MRVLIADDDKISVTLLKSLVERCNYTPVVARDGLEALEILRSKHSPRIALLDWMMPEVDGLQLCRQIRSKESDTNLQPYIILLTARDSRDDVVEGLNSGADDYIVKPFNIPELTARLNAGRRVIELQEQLADRLLELQNSQQKLQTFFNAIQSVSQPVVITDPEGKIVDLNDSFGKMYGYKSQEVLGKTPRVLNPGRHVYKNLGYTDEHYDSLYQDLWSSIKNPDKGKWENAIINRKKDGTLVWVRLVINAVFDPNGELKNFVGLPIDISKSQEKENLTKIQLYQTIADLSELRDNETGNHMRRVGIFCKLIAKELGMIQKFCDDIELFAPMHDIGKVGIPDAILLAKRKLTNEEFDLMKTHTTMGYNIVKGNSELEMVADISLYHHERYDGRGYPEGLAGEAIPLAARITSIADVYDALRSKRPYKDEWPHQEAKQELIKNAGTQFDPQLISIFEKIHEAFETAYNELRG